MKGASAMTGKGASGSRITGFSRLGQRERLATLAAGAGLPAREALESLIGAPLSFDVADHMIENAIGVFGLPFGVGLNFQVNGRDRIVPMAVEEPSVVAAASSPPRLARAPGGCPAAPAEPKMVRRGGGARAIELRELSAGPCGPVLVLHLVVDVGDAMGANIVNTMVEAIPPGVVAESGGEARLCILSNLADRRLARASVRLPFEVLRTDALDGEGGAGAGAEGGGRAR